MTIRASDAERLWDEFSAHLQSCPTCSDPSRAMCAIGRPLYVDWSRADAIVARMEQESDCADDERAPWSPDSPLL